MRVGEGTDRWPGSFACELPALPLTPLRAAGAAKLSGVVQMPLGSSQLICEQLLRAGLTGCARPAPRATVSLSARPRSARTCRLLTLSASTAGWRRGEGVPLASGPPAVSRAPGGCAGGRCRQPLRSPGAFPRVLSGSVSVSLPVSVCESVSMSVCLSPSVSRSLCLRVRPCADHREHALSQAPLRKRPLR